MHEIQFAAPEDLAEASDGRLSVRTVRRHAEAWGGIRATRRWMFPIAALRVSFCDEFADAVRRVAADRLAREGAR